MAANDEDAPANSDPADDAGEVHSPDPKVDLSDEDGTLALFSAYHEDELSADARTQMQGRLQSDKDFASAYQAFTATMEALSGMHKMAAPVDFGDKVEDTIHRRSGGRFFGRKAFGERIPYELLAIVVMLIAAGIYWVGRSSSTGSHKLNDGSRPEVPTESTTP